MFLLSVVIDVEQVGQNVLHCGLLAPASSGVPHDRCCMKSSDAS